MSVNLQFNPPGPVAAAFFADRSEVSAIMGPMGSGKTTAILMKILNLAAEPRVSPIADKRFPGKKVRYTKVGVVRETSTNLKRTTIKSIKTWFGEGGPGMRWFGGGSSPEPLSFQVNFALNDGTVVDLVFEFIGLDGNNIEDLAKGWEITHYWLNEGDLLAPDIKDFLDGRIGRYPSKVHGGASFYCGLLDYNAPDTDNYLYKLYEEIRPEGHRLFKQPGGRSAGAENTQNLPPGYYERMIRGKKKWWIRRNVDSQYGFSREGEPVYEDYNDDFHCSAYDLPAVEGLPIKLYADAETHPAVIFSQTMPNGQRRILGEVYIRGGAKQLGAACLQYAAEHFPAARLVGGTVDPSADRMDAKDSDLKNWLDTLSDAMGLTGGARFTKAPTNDPSKRTSAVDDLLTTVIDGAKPAILISPRAKITRKGFNSDYCFKKRANGTIDDKPTKAHPASDVHDAIQYFALDDGGYEKTMVRERRAANRGNFSKCRQARVEVPI